MTLPKNRFARGDIVLAAFPFTDLSGNKRRPALIIAAEPNASDATLAFISSVVPANLTAYEIVLTPSASDFYQTGLKVASVLRLNKLATIERNLITRKLGQLAASRLLQVDDVLIKAFGIDLSRYLTAEHRRLGQILAVSGLDALRKALQVN
jgi:mRNA interferase MazF